jgi:hypothetical protein
MNIGQSNYEEEQEKERQDLIHRIHHKFIRNRKTNFEPDYESNSSDLNPFIPEVVDELPVPQLPTYHIPHSHPKTMIESPSFSIDESFTFDDRELEKKYPLTLDLSKMRPQNESPSSDIPLSSKAIDPPPSSSVDTLALSCPPSSSCNVYIYSLSTVIAILLFLLLVILKFIMETKKLFK